MIMILGGTSEARKITESLLERNLKVLLTTTTPYHSFITAGAEKNPANLCWKVGEINRESMEDLIKEQDIRLLLDLTHPFAERISKLAIEVAKKLGIEYIRYERATCPLPSSPNIISVPDYLLAAQKAMDLGELIFLTTGTKNLDTFVNLAKESGKRIVARILPIPSSVERCLSLGLDMRDIVAMEGPFSTQLNETLFRYFKADVIVTKESGYEGGVKEKIEAASDLKIPVIVILRPNILYPTVIHDYDTLLEKIEKRKG